MKITRGQILQILMAMWIKFQFTNLSNDEAHFCYTDWTIVTTANCVVTALVSYGINQSVHLFCFPEILCNLALRSLMQKTSDLSYSSDQKTWNIKLLGLSAQWLLDADRVLRFTMAKASTFLTFSYGWTPFCVLLFSRTEH